MVISVWACQSLQLSLTLCGHMDCSQSAPLSIGFSMQEYWSGLPCLPPGDLPVLGMEPVSLMSPALAGSFFTTSATWEALYLSYFHCGLQGQIHLENSLLVIFWRREWQSTLVFLSGEFHGQRSLAGYSPWGCKESDMTEQLTCATRITHVRIIIS